MQSARTNRCSLGLLTIMLLAVTAPAVADETRPVDVVVAVDVSGSMEKLLDATRARIWDVVNELGKMKPTPELRVGLISFGTDRAGEEAGHVVNHLDLTDDLDAVYAELMGLTIGGGSELVGRAINESLDNMSWTPAWDALRIVFIAGNEDADQGVESFDFRIEAEAARDRDIIINALYAGNREQGVSEKWHEVAQAGKGNFSAIDPSTASIQIATPQDEILLALNEKLNTTYVPYGEKGRDGLANQVAQDSNASRLGVQSCSSRIVAKGGALYNNASWDLVDRTLEDGFDWNSIPLRDLPKAMQSMSDEERIQFIEAKRVEREGIQREIRQASEAREAFVQAAIARQIGESDLGQTMRKVIRDQAIAKGFRCDDC
jgi:hypothetical protein